MGASGAMGFVGEAGERLERSQSFIRGFFEVAAKERAVDVAFESLDHGISGCVGDELHVEGESGCREEAHEGVERGAGLAALDPGDNGLRGPGPAGELALSQAGAISRLAYGGSPIRDSLHAIMIA
jgi:hypothetical protein